jgi:general secretion pathway protein E
MTETLVETAGPSSAKATDSLGAMLVARGLVTQADIDRAIEARQSPDHRLGDILVRQGLLDESDLISASSELLGYDIVDETTLPTAADVIDCAKEARISLEWLCDRDALVWRGPQGEIFCTARDPLNPLLQEAVERAAPMGNARYFFARARLVDALIETIRQTIVQERAAAGSLRDLAEDAPTVTFVDGIISEAARDQASDIHIEPDERQLIVRFRVDGVLRTRSVEPRSRYDAIASRVKLLSGMDIAERRLPQDGRISRRIGGEKIDFRVSTLPGAHGESIVMRLLRGQRQLMTLGDLGMEPDHYETLRRLIHSPHGIILVSGPTGSGKTTTLYAAIQEVKDGKKKLVTVEDPIEYMMEGVTQVQARADIGYDFARALRSILRQDPDVIMVGEIRDQETARIAIQSALTGHLVFSTVHTNDALSAISRLVDMGIEPFLLAAAVRGVIAQRLVRRVRPDLVEPYRPDPAVISRLPPNTPQHFVRPRGDVGDGAYSGRVAIYEMVAMDDAMAAAVNRGAALSEMRAIARQTGMRTLLEDALIKAARGQTTVAEALRVAAEDSA